MCCCPCYIGGSPSASVVLRLGSAILRDFHTRTETIGRTCEASDNCGEHWCYFCLSDSFFLDLLSKLRHDLELINNAKL